jgi:hypothetical protein
VQPHHAEGLPDAKVEGTAHLLGDVPPEGAQVACQRAPSLRLALLDHLAGLEGDGLHLLQLLLRKVVGRLHHLGWEVVFPRAARRPESHK